VSTVAYNGQFPGPLLRLAEGRSVTVDILNDTDSPEQLHWHGQKVPVSVDGAAEEGAPFIPRTARGAYNGVAFDDAHMTPMFKLRQGRRYRLRMANASDDIHPVHLHRHSFELTRIAGQPTAGVV